MRKQDTQRTTSPSIPVWITVVVVLGALLFFVGAALSKLDPTLLTNNQPMTEAARVYADYTFARDTALGVSLLFLLVVRARRVLAGFMVLVALIRVIDCLDDLTRGALALIPGLLVFAAVFLLGAWLLLRRPLWRAATWQDEGTAV